MPFSPVVNVLETAAPVGLVDGEFHGVGNSVGVHNNVPLGVAGGAADGLDQRRGGTQVPLLVSIQDSHQAYFGQVQTFPEQVDSHHHVVNPQPQVAQDFHPLQGVNVRMQVVVSDAHFREEVGKFFRHSLGQGGNQASLPLVHSQLDLLQQVVNLSFRGLHLDGGVQQPRGTNDLLNDGCAVLHLVGAREWLKQKSPGLRGVQTRRS